MTSLSIRDKTFTDETSHIILSNTEKPEIIKLVGAGVADVYERDISFAAWKGITIFISIPVQRKLNYKLRITQLCDVSYTLSDLRVKILVIFISSSHKVCEINV
jgi:hypothetical protein